MSFGPIHLHVESTRYADQKLAGGCCYKPFAEVHDVSD